MENYLYWDWYFVRICCFLKISCESNTSIWTVILGDGKMCLFSDDFIAQMLAWESNWLMNRWWKKKIIGAAQWGQKMFFLHLDLTQDL